MAKTGTSSAAQENVAELQLGPSFQVRSKTLVEKHCTPSFERSQHHDSHYTLFSFWNACWILIHSFIHSLQDISILSNAQVAVLLQVSATSAVNRDEELNEVYRKTQRYVNRFNSMTNPEKEHQELADELDNLYT